MKVYIVNGAPSSGKTTFEDITLSLIGRMKGCKVSTVDFVKQIAYDCGWDGIKDNKNRKFLSDLKRLLVDWNDVPNNKICEFLQKRKIYLENNDLDSDNYVVFIDCREPEEIERLKRRTGAKTIIVRRKYAELEETSNNSDQNVLDYNYDIEINNNSGIEELKQEVLKFCKQENI